MVPKYEVVAAILTFKGKIALFQRSDHVTGGEGLWHCISGFLSEYQDPYLQATLEIAEETTIPACKLDFRGYSVLDKKDQDGNTWKIHAFHFETSTDSIHLNWEHSSSQWTDLRAVKMLSTVYWLYDVIKSLSGTIKVVMKNTGYEDLRTLETISGERIKPAAWKWENSYDVYGL